VAENVGGLLSADDGVALARCIRELLDSGACETGWRVVDSQYFGVAQRRKRVFIVSDFGGESCDQILAITESLPGHPAPSREAGKGTAGDATESVGEGEQDIVGTLCNADHKGAGNQYVNDNKLIVEQKETYCLQGGGETSQSSQGSGVNKDVAFTLNGLDKHGVAYEQEGIAFEPKSLDGPPRVTGDIKKVVSPSLNCMTGGGREPAVVSWNGDTTPKASEDVSVTLRSQQGGEGVGVAFQKSELRLKDKIELKQISPTLKAETKQGDTEVNVLQKAKAFHATQDPIHSEEHTPALGSNATIGVAFAFDSLASNSMKSSNPVSGCNETDISKTLDTTTPEPSKNQGGIAIHQNLTVRRLTPIECERLQGFPDNWTSEKMELTLEGNEWKATGKVVKQADGPRYRQQGNAVTVNVAEWIGKQIGKVLS
jgi:DNA (cytosine-5)-methyltransferase 1